MAKSTGTEQADMLRSGFVHVIHEKSDVPDVYYKVFDVTSQNLYIEHRSYGERYRALFAYVRLNVGDAPVSRMIRYWCQAVSPDSSGQFPTRWIQLGGEARLLDNASVQAPGA